MALSPRAKRTLPPIPDLPANTDLGIRTAFAALKEALEVRLGRRGDPMEEGVTKRQLLDSGIARLTSPLGSELMAVVSLDAGQRIVPPMPAGFSAQGVFGGVTLTWENPFEAYGVHSFAEVWRSETSDIEDRVLIDSSRGAIFFDKHEDPVPLEYWYWVRYVSEFDRTGAFSLPFRAKKLDDVAVIMDRISGQIDQSSLTAAFLAEYDGINGTVARHDQTLGVQGTKIEQQSSVLTGLSAQYTLRLDVNGYVSGFGAFNDGATSDFSIVADRFWIASPNSVGRTRPFVIDKGVTYLDTAIIRDGTIQEGKLGPITFGKIVDGAGNPITTRAGKLRADAIDVTSLQVTDANIAGVLRSNATGANGQPRWVLDKNGGMTLNGSGAGGRMEIFDTVIKVFDGNNRIRVQLGDLSL
jgi:hypothetical protein